MTATLGFDVYGTLIDTHGVIVQLQTMIDDKAQAFSNTWREKQLEYTFRRGLMRQYKNFPVCTRQALDYCCRLYQIDLSDEQKQSLMAGYLTLPTFADVETGLDQLKQAGLRMYAFSNGIGDALETLLTNAGIRDYFLGVVSVDDIQSFKPNPDVYQHFLDSTDANADSAWLISSNGFDVIGAVSYGMHAAWVQRSAANVFDPWDIEPTLVVNSLIDLAQHLSQEQVTN